MKGDRDQILVPGSEDSDQFSAQMAALEKQFRKMKKRKKGKKSKSKKKLKKLEKQLELLMLEHQQLKKLAQELLKRKKGKKSKNKKKLKKKLRALELQCQQRQPWWHDAITASVSKVLDLAIVSKSGQPLKTQPPLALPAPRSQR